MKINTLLVFSLFIININAFCSPLDSIQELYPIDNPEYIGYRMAIVDLSVSPDKNNQIIKVSFTPINTGRKDLMFGANISDPPQLVVTFDETLQSTGLVPHVEAIKSAIIKEDFHIASGKIAKPRTIKIAVSASTPAENITDTPSETSELENPRLVDTPTKEKEETFTEKAAPVDDFEMMLAGSARAQYDENACSDLVFESVRVVKKSKNKVTLEYTIVNNGEGPAKLINSKKQERKNLALQAYLSSKDKTTKSSLSLDNDFLQKGLEDTNGRLYPGDRFTGTIKINIQKMTKFTPFVILELDPYLTVRECDKTNNKLGVKVGEGKE